MTPYAKLARNNAWANVRLLAACERLMPDEWEAERTGFFPSIGQTLNHIHAVDLYYLDALEEAGLGRRAFFEAPHYASAAHLRPAQAAADARLLAFCDALTEDRLTMRVATDRGAKDRVDERVDHLLLHLFQHQIHHRGQAHAMLSGSAVAPPQLDEFFLDFDRGPDAEPLP